MERFLTLSYYFNRLPDPDFQYTKVTLTIGVFLVLAGFALAFFRRKYLKNEIWKKVIRKYPSLLRTYGFLALLLLLFREAGIPYLSMRFLWALLLGFFLYHLFKFLLTFKKDYKKRLEQAARHSAHRQYLPRRKK
ncbi:hypothetical protein JXA05_04430 [Candidatus Peregrinibacteria bacterium]|nr:hypothetical protein [Candidatus Peregrinibacteria bacterium]